MGTPRRLMREKGAVLRLAKVVSFLLQGDWILSRFAGTMWRESDPFHKEHEDDTTSERSATDS